VKSLKAVAINSGDLSAVDALARFMEEHPSFSFSQSILKGAHETEA
jgi:hypothetical protein